MSGEKKTLRVKYDPLTELMAYYSGRKGETTVKARPSGSLEDRLKNRIIDGDRVGLHAELDEALKKYTPLDIINNILLGGMKVVGDLFGSGQMQLPFVLQSAEVMKAAVAYLEKFMDKADATSKGSMVIATVKGDVHDIGKNLVDIILTNNGYKVYNLGIKCPIDTMLHSVQEHNADAIGMSGLLVKSTLIMKENLEVMNERGLTIPVVLGGAALTRKYVEQDLRNIYRGDLSYANDAFDGLHFMEELVTSRDTGGRGSAVTQRRDRPTAAADEEILLSGLEAKIALAPRIAASSVKPSRAIPAPPFYGTKVVAEVDLDEVYRYINETALFRGQWQVRRGKLSEEEYHALVKEKIHPDFVRLKALAKQERLLQPRVVYGYFPCNSSGDDLVIYKPTADRPPGQIGNWRLEIGNTQEWLRFTFPRQLRGKGLCLADFFASKESGLVDVVAFHLVTVGSVASDYAQTLFKSNHYKEYLYFHGLSVECAEALAELWHKKIREEMGIHHADSPDVKRLFSQGYQGSRYSFGYPACPSLEDHVKLFQLLRPERIGVELTEEFQLVPEQSTDAIIVHHPEARYFNI